MAKPITWVGIDDHKHELTVAVVVGQRQQDAAVERVVNEDRALGRWLRKLMRAAAGGEIRMCYEAGPNGFALKRRLETLGPVIVEVVAPTLTPRRPGQRVKTDPIDARKLVLLFRAGELTEIAMPSEEDEAARDLVRTRRRVVGEATRKRHHILKFLVRRGRIYRDGHHWTQRHRLWLAQQRWDDWKDAMTFEELMTGLRELEDRLLRLERMLERLAQEDRYRLPVAVLRCFHGFDTASAVGLTAEIFAIERFPHPRMLAGYLGLAPTVRQSGGRECRGGISKAGNAYARWLLGQVAWHYRHGPRVGVALKKRREGQPAWAVAIADRAHQRLHRRFWALVNRGVPPQKALIAVARELVSFVWEALREANARQQQETANVA
jgi:transposase